MWNNFKDFMASLLESSTALSIAYSILVVLAAVLLIKIINRRLLASSLHTQTSLLLRRASTGVLLTVAIVWSLSLAGVDISVLLGTAGVLTVALGFASQTSVSNLISGIFLMAERPFKVGDIIEVDTRTGEVIAIDMLSVKLRTFDNLLVRIPNETMFKANVTNMTHFDIRRYDLLLSIAYKEDMRLVREVLTDVADNNPLCLQHPAPLVIFLAFGESSINLQFSIWAKKESFLDLRNSIAEEVKRAFDRASIEIPFPQRTLHPGPGFPRTVPASQSSQDAAPR